MIVKKILILILLLSNNLLAITWDFEKKGILQGWRVEESYISGRSTGTLSRLPSEVYEGIWHIYMPPFEKKYIPSLVLYSPLLNYDSTLFDRVMIRFRVVHSRPIEGSVYLGWVNEINYREPLIIQQNGFWFSRRQEITYTGDWQEIVIGNLSTGPVEEGEYSPIFWEGKLSEIQLDMVLSRNLPGSFTGTPEDIPEAIEIDWIKLTGVEEVLQGELLPPSVPEEIYFGELFADAVFCGLGRRGVQGLGIYGLSHVMAGLGDVDGDRDLDLIATQFGEYRDWFYALNDGKGNFSHSVYQNSNLLYMQVGDINMDGYLDIYEGVRIDHSNILLNRGEKGSIDWVITSEIKDLYPIGGMADADGDGDPDLWMIDDFQTNELLLLMNDGTGNFDQKETVEIENWRPAQLVKDIGKGRISGILWINELGEPGYRVTYFDTTTATFIHQHLAVDMIFNRLAPQQLHYIGDFDMDGDVDLVSSREVISRKKVLYRGLVFRVNKGNGAFETIDWYNDAELTHNVEFLDLNRDGVLDPVFVDSNERNPAVMVHLGVAGSLPRLEGRYPLRGQGGAVLGGDVDGDGDVDLVVLERAVDGQGGVHVLLNRLNDQTTAVQERQSCLSPSFRLGVNYPNPFNPQTWIPFDIPAGSGSVDLRIYNLLGQPVRTLVAGHLSAGQHVAPWDGRDQRGQEVGSGVYLYRLQAGAWTATGKMVKSE